MSTKIYDAYKLAQPYTLYQLNQKLDELRVEIQKIGIRSIWEKAIELTLYVYNYKCACGTEAVNEIIEKTDMTKHLEIKLNLVSGPGIRSGKKQKTNSGGLSIMTVV